MADNNASGQDTRLSGASEISAAPSDCTASKRGLTSAKAYKRSKKAKSPLEEASPESSFPKSVGTLSSSNSPSAKTNKRTHFTPQQIYKLEQFFLKSQFPTAKDRETLAKELQLSVKHIQVWFQNHRAKYKRKEKKKEATQKSTVKLQPPSNWPSALPFDSSIASLGSSSSGSKGKDGKGESVSKISISVSPSGSYSSPESEEVSGSFLQSSPEKQTPYPLSPSSPLPTPHAPIKRHSSSLAPESPLSSGVCSPDVVSKLIGNQLSPSSQTSSATTVSQDPSQLYSSDIAESPVPLYDILDDPDLVSILREHLPPSKILPDSNYHLPCGSFQISSYYGQSSSMQSQVGYGPSPAPFHNLNYNLSPSPLTTPAQSHISSSTTTPNPTNTAIQQQLHPLSMQEKQRPLLSHIQSRTMRHPYPHPNQYRPSTLPLTPLPGYSDLSSPHYSPNSPQPFPQAYTQDPSMMYQQSLPLIGSTQFPHRLSTPQRTHVPGYHHNLTGSSTPSATTASPNLYQSLEPNQEPPAR